jgi:chaperone BCS1
MSINTDNTTGNMNNNEQNIENINEEEPPLTPDTPRDGDTKNNNVHDNRPDNTFLYEENHNKITISNIMKGKTFFYRLLSYLSEQFFYIETSQKDKQDPNIIFMKLDECNSQNNRTYSVSNGHFKGKDLCSLDFWLNHTKLMISYKFPSKFKKSFKNDCDENGELFVRYEFETNIRKFEENIIKNSHVDEYAEIIFHPKNKLSLKYFELFISSIIYSTKNVNKNFLINKSNITVYINIDSYWEELFNRPSRSIESIYLPKEDKKNIIDDFEWFLSKDTQLRYEQLGRNYKRVVLFEGVPGSGKTSLALAIASHFGYDMAILNFTDKVTDGTFTRLVRQMPEKTILLLEDIDCLFHERKNNDNYKNQVTFSGILNTLDGIATPHEFICIITTNYKNLLDDAILRPGRIDNIIRFDYAKRGQIRDIYKVYMGEKYDINKFKEFYGAYKDLNVECTVSLIQEYLFKYLDKPTEALENIDEIKELREQSTKKNADVYM